MAKFHHLEVYQLSYRFTKMIFETKIKLPKTLKGDLGQMTFLSALKLTRGVIIASSSQDKSKVLNLVALEIDVIWQFLRLMYDLKGISKGEFQVLSEVLTDISDQIQKWLNWSKENNKKSSESKARIK